VVIYDKAIVEGDPEVCQKVNFLDPLLFLEECRQQGKACLLVSLACVFGEKFGNGLLTESSIVRPEGIAGKMLALAEEKFVAYEKGFVLRVSDPLRIVMGAMEEVRLHSLQFKDRQIEPVCERVVEFVAGKLETAVDPPKVLHLPSHVEMAFSEAMFGVYGEAGWHVSGENGAYPLWPHPGRIRSKLVEKTVGWSDMVLAYAANSHMVRLVLSPSLRGRV